MAPRALTVVFVALTCTTVPLAGATDAAAAAGVAQPLADQPPPPPTTPAAADSKQGVFGYLCSQQGNLVSSARSPVWVYLHSLHKVLQDYPHQGVIAFFAVVIGMLCVWDGPRIWQGLFTATMVGMATGFARIEAEAWDLDMVSKILLMFQSAFAMAIAIQSGFEGFQVLFGTAMGFLATYGCGDWARQADAFVPGIALFWYSVGGMLGALVLTVWQRPMLVTLGPLLGGFLMTTGLVTISSSICAATSAARGPSLLPPLDASWISNAGELLSLAGPGAFAAHGACAVVATLLYRTSARDERRLPAAGCLVACVLMMALIAASRGSTWLAGSCLLWALITGPAAFRQLGMLQDWQAKSLAEVAETFSNVGSTYFGRSGYGAVPKKMGQDGGLASYDLPR